MRYGIDTRNNTSRAFVALAPCCGTMGALNYKEPTMANRKNEVTPRERKFAELYASGLYSKSGAAREAGYNPASASTQATKQLRRKVIVKLVKQFMDEDRRLQQLDATWVKQQLAKIAHKAEQGGQYTESISALDKLGKAHGVYEKDNQQKAAVSLKMEF